MSTLPGKRVRVAPRFYAFALIRIFIVTVAGAALAVLFLCAGNLHTATQLLGGSVGQMVSTFDATQDVVAAGAILGAASLLFTLARGGVASLLMVVLLVAAGGLVINAQGWPLPVVFLVGIICAGLIGAGSLIALVLPAPPRPPRMPWRT